MTSSSDLGINTGLSPEKSPEAVDVITKSRARGAKEGDARREGSEELLGQSMRLLPLITRKMRFLSGTAASQRDILLAGEMLPSYPESPTVLSRTTQ